MAITPKTLRRNATILKSIGDDQVQFYYKDTQPSIGGARA